MSWISLHNDGCGLNKEPSTAEEVSPNSEKRDSANASVNKNNFELMPTSRIIHECYQTYMLVTVQARIKCLMSEQLKVDMASTTLGVTAKLPVSRASNENE